jgi:organic radical activating enzyme
LWVSDPGDWLGIDETVAKILGLAKQDNCQGLTISGGEPFEQLPAIESLLTRLLPSMPDILIYSGHYRQEWERSCQIIKRIACLIDGYFDLTRPCDDAWRGSDNQNMIIYSPDLADCYEKWRQTRKGALQLARPEGRILGIPYIDR